MGRSGKLLKGIKNNYKGIKSKAGTAEKQGKKTVLTDRQA